MSITTSDMAPQSISYFLKLNDYSIEDLMEILDSLAKYKTVEMKTDDERMEIIELFLRVFSSLTRFDSTNHLEDDSIKEFSEKTKSAYDNIYPVAADMAPSSDITVVAFDFLKRIKEDTRLNLDLLDETKTDLLSYLAGIEVIFKLKVDGAYLFPIGNVLREILGNKDMLDNAKSTYDEDQFFFIIRLALMVFEVSDKNEYNELRSELQKANLGFLLSENKLNAKDDWTYWNFKRNNVLVIVTSEEGQNRVYVHAASKTYFNTRTLEEKTAKGVIIGYNWSRTLPHSESQISLDDLLNKDDTEINRQLAEIIFDRHQRNVFAPGFLTYDWISKQVQPLNPFTRDDEFIISTTTDNASFEKICQKYYTKRLIRNGLRSLTFGLLHFLNQISGKPVSFIFDKVRNSSGVLQNEAIRHYLDKYPVDLPNLMKNFEQAMRKLNSSSCKIEDCMLYPLYFDFTNTIVDRVVSEKQRQDKKDPIELKTAQVTIESGIPYLELGNGTLLRKEEIADDIPNANGLPVALVQQGEQYSIEQDYRDEIILLGKIAENRNLLTEDNVSKYNHSQIDRLAELMSNLQWQYDSKNQMFASIKDMCVMRLANHIANCLKESTYDKVNSFLATITSLPQIKGETLKDIEKELTSENTIVVLKTISDYGNTCSRMLDKHIVHKGFHAPLPWSPGKVLEKNQSGLWSYSRSGYPSISKIIFLFDNAISGRSTTESLRNYFNGKFNVEAYPFRTKAGKINLKTLIKDNNIKDIDIIVLYATYKAEKRIDDTISKIKVDYPNIKINRQIKNPITENSEVLFNRFQELYKPNLLSTDQCTYVLREFNQPKMNWLIDALYKQENLNAIFILDEPIYANTQSTHI